MVKYPPANEGGLVLIPGEEGSLEKEMATHSSILAWNIPWTEEPGGQGPKESDTTEHSIWSWSWRLLKALSMNSVFFF